MTIIDYYDYKISTLTNLCKYNFNFTSFITYLIPSPEEFALYGLWFLLF